MGTACGNVDHGALSSHMYRCYNILITVSILYLIQSSTFILQREVELPAVICVGSMWSLSPSPSLTRSLYLSFYVTYIFHHTCPCSLPCPYNVLTTLVTTSDLPLSSLSPSSAHQPFPHLPSTPPLKPATVIKKRVAPPPV